MELFIGDYRIFFGIEKPRMKYFRELEQYLISLGLTKENHPDWSVISLKIERIKALRKYHNPSIVKKFVPVEMKNGADFVGLAEAKYVVELLYSEGV